MRNPIVLPVAIFTLAALSSLASTAHAQTTSDSQLWTQFTFNARVHENRRIRLFAEVQPRFGENYNHTTQFVARPAVGYQVNRIFSVWFGYGWTPSFFPEFNGENRTFQQLLWEDKYNGTTLINRTRLEERWIEHAGDVSWRLRHQFRASHPVSPGSQWSYLGYNELFWHLNSTPRGPVSGFDQDRLFLGMFYNASRHTRLELGYMPTYLNPRTGPDRRLDILMFTMNYTL